jgi:hypothetical protein
MLCLCVFKTKNVTAVICAATFTVKALTACMDGIQLRAQSQTRSLQLPGGVQQLSHCTVHGCLPASSWQKDG